MSNDDIPISIGIPSRYPSFNFTYMCVMSMIKLAKNPGRLHFHICVDLNKATTRDDINLDNIVALVPNSQNIQITYVTTNYDRSSLSHGIILNNIYQQFISTHTSTPTTKKYYMLIDNDMVFCHKNWDELLLDTLINTKSVILGIPYSDKMHYRDFPCARLILFDLEVMKPLNIDFKPHWDKDVAPETIIVKDIAMSKKYNVPMGSLMVFDTGIQLYEKMVIENKFPYVCMTTSGKISNMFHLGTTLIASHFDRGSKTGSRDQRLIVWIAEMTKIISKTQGVSINFKYPGNR